MKIIFLDFDGVLNSWAWQEANKDLLKSEGLLYRQHLDRDAVARLNRIVAATGAVVVISSTWRRLYKLVELREILANHGFSGIVLDVTPHMGRRRGEDIAEWLASAPQARAVSGFVILDDDSDMEHLTHKLVQTSYETGLQDGDVEAAIAQLMRQPLWR